MDNTQTPAIHKPYIMAVSQVLVH